MQVDVSMVGRRQGSGSGIRGFAQKVTYRFLDIANAHSPIANVTAMYSQPKQLLRILHIFVAYLAIGDCPFQIGLRGRSRLFGQKPDQGSGVTGQTLVPDPSPDQFTTDRSTSSSFCRLSLRKKVLP